MRVRAALATLLFTVPLTLAIATLGGCSDEDSPPGSATVAWRIGGHDCEGAGLEWIDVELLRRGEVYDVQRAPCERAEITFPSVEPGVYDVQVWGYPPQDPATADDLDPSLATYEGAQLELRVRSGQETRTAGAVELVARKGEVFLNWRFRNGMSCLYNGVAQIEIGIYDSFGNLDHQLVYDCDLRDYLETLPPAERGNVRGVHIPRLDSEPLVIELLGVDAHGTPSHRGDADIHLDHGEVRDLIIDLAPCSSSSCL